MKEINIGGKKRPFRIGVNAGGIFCTLRDCKFSEFQNLFERIKDQDFNIEEIRDLIYSGLVAGAKSAGQEVDFNNFQVGDWIDETPAAEIQKAFASMTDDAPGAKKKPKGKARK